MTDHGINETIFKIVIVLCVYGAILAKSLKNNPKGWWKEDPNYFQQNIRMPNARSDRGVIFLGDVIGIHWTAKSLPVGQVMRGMWAVISFGQAYVTLEESNIYFRASSIRQKLRIKYEPHASKTITHHMMVYGCGHPGSSKPYWSCGEMDDRSDVSVCKDGQRQIVYAWAMNANSRELPEGVGFRVGGTTNIKYLIVQMHYKDVFTENQTDNSGVTLHMTYTPQPKQAGFYVLGNYGYIPPNVKEFHLESACEYSDKETIYPIGYRTHSHNLGVVTAGYRIRNGTWTEIGRMSPQLPQTFYDITTSGIDIRTGDILAARCTMSSDREEVTSIGPTNKDEMCNFYILYYTYKHSKKLDVQYCFRDAQTFHWKDYLINVPNNASSIEGLPNFIRNDPFANNKKQRQVKHVVHDSDVM